MPTSFDIFSITWNLISSFGNLVIRTILIGCMYLSFAMALIVVVASELAVTIKARLTMNPSSEKDSK